MPGHGGTGGKTLPYQQREPLRVFVQRTGSVQGASGKSTMRAVWRIGWRERDPVQEMPAIVRSQGRGPRKRRFWKAGWSPPRAWTPLCPSSSLGFPVSWTPAGAEPLT